MSTINDLVGNRYNVAIQVRAVPTIVLKYITVIYIVFSDHKKCVVGYKFANSAIIAIAIIAYHNYRYALCVIADRYTSWLLFYLFFAICNLHGFSASVPICDVTWSAMLDIC